MECAPGEMLILIVPSGDGQGLVVDLCRQHTMTWKPSSSTVASSLEGSFLGGHNVCSGCHLGMDGWIDGWKGHRDLGLKILSKSRVRVIMNHTALPATRLSPGEEDQHWLRLGRFGGGCCMWVIPRPRQLLYWAPAPCRVLNTGYSIYPPDTFIIFTEEESEIQRGLLAHPGTESWTAELIHIRICQLLTGKVPLCYFLQSFPFIQAEREISTAFPSHQTLGKVLCTLVLTTASEGRGLLFPFNREEDWGTCGLLAWLRARGEYVTELRYSCGSSWLQGLCLHWLAFISDHHAPGICWEKAVAPHSSALAWEIPWMEEPGRLQSMGSLRVGHDWATSLSLFTSMHWRRKWQPTPVFLSGESQGQGSLVGCGQWGRTESDMTEAT